MQTGDVLGHWTLLYPGRQRAGAKMWLCRCRCLTIREVLASNLCRKSRSSRSCGCHRLVMNEQRRLARHEAARSLSMAGLQTWMCIELTTGQQTLVSVDCYADLCQFTWHAVKKPSGTYYAARTIRVGLKTSVEYMARRIMKAPDGVEVDHRNGHSLDNRTWNLRFATTQQNQFNRGKNRNNTSGYKGVTWEKSTGKYQAQIRVNGQTKHLGRFDDKIDAAHAYDQAALKYHGRFARVNFPVRPVTHGTPRVHPSTP